DDHVGLLALRLLDRLEDDRRGIRAILALHDLTADAPRPDLELQHGRSTERVAGREHDLLASFVIAARELADRRGLADSVHPPPEDRGRARAHLDAARRRAEDRARFFSEPVPHGVLVPQLTAIHLRAERR